MGTKERLYAFLKEKKLKPSAFERKCGLSNGFCSKVNENITDGSIMLIQKGFPELNINWLRSGFGDMLHEEQGLEYSNGDGSNMMAMVKMMQEFIQLGKKNADANLMNAEANKLNAQNLERLITLLEHKFE